MNLLLKSIRVIDPLTKRDAVCDVHIVDGIIERIGTKLTAPAGCDVREMKGMIAAPGFFDMHVHFREPGNEGAETIATGAACAAESGFTGVMLMPNTTPAIDSAAMVRFVRGRAKGALVDVFTSGCIRK